MTDAPSMSQAPAAAAEAAPDKLNLAYHLIIGLAMGLVAPFTLLAWIPAILTGMVIGRADVERTRGIRSGGASSVLRVLAVTGGVVAMLFFGALIGGVVAFAVMALAAFSERIAGGTSTTDQGIARILISIVAAITWAVIFVVFKFNLNISIG